MYSLDCNLVENTGLKVVQLKWMDLPSSTLSILLKAIRE